jgi:hypothetical protein
MLTKIKIKIPVLKHPASLAFFFRLVDVDGDGALSPTDLKFFYPELASAYNAYNNGLPRKQRGDPMPAFEDFCDQLFDMAGPNLGGGSGLEKIESENQSTKKF